MLCFPLAAVLAVNERVFSREARVGSGVVVSLGNGPHHATAKVTLPGRRSPLLVRRLPNLFGYAWATYLP